MVWVMSTSFAVTNRTGCAPNFASQHQTSASPSTSSYIMSFSPIESNVPPPTTKKEKYRHSKSEEARHLEQAAILAFENYRASHSNATTGFRVNLLSPTHHLTGPCWSTFSQYVRSYPGWLAKRRVATPEEKITLQITCRMKVYWIDLKFDPHRANKKVAELVAAQQKTTLIDTTNQDSKRPAAEGETSLQPALKKIKIPLDISDEEDSNHGVDGRVTP